MYGGIVLAALVSTASCSSKDGDKREPQRGANPTTHTDAKASHGHQHEDTWTLRKLLSETLPLLGKTIEHARKQHEKALTKRASGHVLTLPPVGRRPRKSFVLLEVDDKTKLVSELVLQFAMANDGDDIRNELVRRFGPARTSREHKCMMRGCVYGKTVLVIAREIETRLAWSIRVKSAKR